jgi:hypothetical protein
MSPAVRRAARLLAGVVLVGQLAAPVAAHAGKVPKACPPPIGPATKLNLTVAAGKGSIAVSWTAPPLEVSRIKRWRIAAVDSSGSAQQTAVTWQTVKAGTTCKTVKTTLKGLTSGHVYEVWLEVVAASSAWDGSTVNRMVGRASGVQVG